MEGAKKRTYKFRCGEPRKSDSKPCQRGVAKKGSKCYAHRPPPPKTEAKAETKPMALPGKADGVTLLAKSTDTRIGSWDGKTGAWSGVIHTVLRTGPSAKDGAGFVYMFLQRNDDRLVVAETDDFHVYRKIGLTMQDEPDDRLNDWHGPKLVMAWHVRYTRLAERLIHLLLDSIRVYRKPYEKDPATAEEDATRADLKRYLSTWKAKGTWVKDSAYHHAMGPWSSRAWPRDIVDTIKERQGNAATKGQEIEWFLGKEWFMRLVCRTVVSAINSWQW